MNIIAVIPARRGSKAIPHKNIRMLNGKPLVAYAIENAISSKYINRVIVTTDSPEVQTIAQAYERVTVHHRPAELAGDTVPLDPVIKDAISGECAVNDVVVTLQPTSPCLRLSTLDTAIRQFIDSSMGTGISVIADPHLSWGVDVNGKPCPRYWARVNRQMLPVEYREAGAFVLSRVTTGEFSRISSAVDLYPLPDNEGIDIDSWTDFMIAEQELQRREVFTTYDERFPVYGKQTANPNS